MDEAPVWRRHILGGRRDDVERDKLVWIFIAALDMTSRYSEEYVGEAGRGSLHSDQYASSGGPVRKRNRRRAH